MHFLCFMVESTRNKGYNYVYLLFDNSQLDRVKGDKIGQRDWKNC